MITPRQWLSLVSTFKGSIVAFLWNAVRCLMMLCKHSGSYHRIRHLGQKCFLNFHILLFHFRCAFHLANLCPFLQLLGIPKMAVFGIAVCALKIAKLCRRFGLCTWFG